MSENKDILLDIRDLSVQFNTDSGVVKAVNHLNMHLERGKSLGFVGETGAGTARSFSTGRTCAG